MLFWGLVTTRLGSNYVYACTEAVEEVIVKHYQEQIKYLDKTKIDENLKKKLKSFVKKRISIELVADRSIKENSLGLKVFKNFTKNITKLAIKISKKI